MEGRRVAPEGRQKDSKPSLVVAAPIKQAQEFLRRVGRPRVVLDRKAHRREYMKGWRARQK